MAVEEGFYIWKGDSLVLRVRLQPRAHADEIVGTQNGALKIRITAPPVEGKANDHLIRFLAGLFGIPSSRITLLSGDRGKEKRLLIQRPARLPEFIRRATTSGS